jgi:hypothetical protein
MAAASVVQRRQQDPLVEVDRGSRDRQRAQQPEHTRASADLGGAGGTALDVCRQAGSIGRSQLIEQEGIDERPGACAVQRRTNVRVRHITYMT